MAECFDEAPQITTRFLKRRGALSVGTWRDTIQWTRNGRPCGSANYIIQTEAARATMTLSYSYGDKATRYDIALVTQPSNLGRGLVWYFVCPQTGKRCRKLYGIGRYFLHRDAYPQAMYHIQTESKLWRQCKQVPDPWPYGRPKTYAGKWTRAYLRHQREEEKAHASFIMMAGRLDILPVTSEDDIDNTISP